MGTPETFRATRVALGLTQPEMGRLLGMHHMTVSKWERGVLTPPPFRLELLKQLQKASRRKDAGKKIAEALNERGVATGLRVLLEETRP